MKGACTGARSIPLSPAAQSALQYTNRGQSHMTGQGCANGSDDRERFQRGLAGACRRVDEADAGGRGKSCARTAMTVPLRSGAFASKIQKSKAYRIIIRSCPFADHHHKTGAKADMPISMGHVVDICAAIRRPRSSSTRSSDVSDLYPNARSGLGQSRRSDRAPFTSGLPRESGHFQSPSACLKGAIGGQLRSLLASLERAQLPTQPGN
jgi:hypothetical protein